jgi:hypothetical protein
MNEILNKEEDASHKAVQQILEWIHNVEAKAVINVVVNRTLQERAWKTEVNGRDEEDPKVDASAEENICYSGRTR